ncbi:DUF6228 family protein [Candidatus Thiodiazotropha sp. CDECU1]|uniref:DUF6228 family protein n=1 Tax=Candidatus Thiodiazotropha sp. CDECU1 TaxID=3065865 RepID=UPI00292EF1B6|nr:DUF6228 family protein [Candidatus Thiodiazotropha sp. CDECU1]
MESAHIKSTSTSATLIFREREGDYFSIVYDSPAVKIQKRVWGYTDCQALVGLFQSLAQDWKGWEGVREWSSIEGEFGLSASSDNLGHIELSISFAEFDAPEEWSAKVCLLLDSGQTESIAKKVRVFFEN